MTNMNIEFCRSLMKSIHGEVKQAFCVKNVWRACGVTRTFNGRWFGQINLPGSPSFSWNGRAHNAFEARYKVWQAFLVRHARTSE